MRLSSARSQGRHGVRERIVKFEDVRKIGVVGGGVMGGGIAQVMAATAGYEVVVRDISDEAIAKTRETIFDGRWGLKRAVEIGKLEFDRAAGAMQRIHFTTRREELNDCDF